MTEIDGSQITDEVVLLWVARETGVLDALLSSAGTPAEVAEATGIDRRAARIVTEALADRGFFESVGEAFEPANRSLGFLTRRDPRSIGTLPHRVDLLERYRELPAALSSGEVPEEPDHWTTHRLGAVAATDEATVRALVTAAVREQPEAESVLDVGGAPGTFAKEFVRRGFGVTLCDHPEAIEVARPFLAREPIDLVAADYRTGSGESTGSLDIADLPAADLAFVPGVTHRLSTDANRRLFATLADALAPGGVLVAVDHVRGRSPRADAVAVEALATTEAGETYDPDAYRDWATAAGFETVSIRDVPGTDRQAVVAGDRS